MLLQDLRPGLRAVSVIPALSVGIFAADSDEPTTPLDGLVRASGMPVDELNRRLLSALVAADGYVYLANRYSQPPDRSNLELARAAFRQAFQAGGPAPTLPLRPMTGNCQIDRDLTES
jgi:hypothetical protein